MKNTRGFEISFLSIKKDICIRMDFKIVRLQRGGVIIAILRSHDLKTSQQMFQLCVHR